VELSKYIKEILISKDNVIIPNFGAFEKTMLSARIDTVTGEMHPPQIGVVFNSELKIDSGILIKYIAEKESIPEEKVVEEIQGQVKIWEETLNQGQQVLIVGIGILSKDSSGILTFESNISASDFPDSYGLPVIELKDKKGGVPQKEIVPEIQKVEQIKVEQVKVEQKKVEVKKPVVKQRETVIPKTNEGKNPNKKLIIALVIAVPVIAIIVIVALNLSATKQKFNDASKFVSSFMSGKSEIDTTKKAIVISDSLKTLDSTTTETKEILENYTIIDESTNSKVLPEAEKLATFKKVHIISGSFKTKSFANRQRNQLVEKGFKAEVLPERDGLFRVSVASYDDAASAAKDLERIKSIDESFDYWILGK